MEREQIHEQLKLLQASIPSAINALENLGFGLVYQGENYVQRRAELLALGIPAKKIRRVPFTRPAEEK